jgi:hypothetical protein
MTKEFITFQEYLNCRGKTEEKGKVCNTGDVVDLPKPKAKEDPHRRTKTSDKCACTKDKQPQVKEYLDGRGNLVEKPSIEDVADYRGPQPTSPPAQGKNDLTKAAGYPSPYGPANTRQNAAGGESGLGDKGGKELKYEPKTDVSQSKVIPTWPKNTSEWLNRTKKMSLSEFVSSVTKERMIQGDLPTVTTPENNHFYPHPTEAIRYVGALAKNERMLNDLIFEMKRNKVLHKLLGKLMDLPETYVSLNALLNEGELGKRRCNLLNLQMEGVAPPIGIDDEEEEDNDDEEPLPGDLDNLDDEELDDMGDEDDLEGLEDEDDLEGLEDEDDLEGLEDEDDLEGLEDDEDEEDFEDEDDEDEDDEDEEDEEDFEDEDEEDFEDEDEDPRAKLKALLSGGGPMGGGPMGRMGRGPMF